MQKCHGARIDEPQLRHAIRFLTTGRNKRFIKKVSFKPYSVIVYEYAKINKITARGQKGPPLL